jgi:spermidine synthase
VLISAGLLGSAFPLLAHATIASGSGAGKGISYLYLSNILGSTLGSFVVGFIILNYWSTRATCTLLLLMGLGAYVVIAKLSGLPGKTGIIAISCCTCLLLATASGTIYSSVYERLLYGGDYKPGIKFAEFLENRSGEISVIQDGSVFGGGIYDGRFNTDVINDTNGIFRAFAISGLHAHPTNMLDIGLSSGSWAQVAASNPSVKNLTIVEINPGYTSLIERHKDVASLLLNPKVHIVIDDGRRWLVSHPYQRFDFILMNTTYNWRANASNLLSKEFLELLKSHLNAGGIAYYNTTGSNEVIATAASVFPYSARIANFIAVSDSPLNLDIPQWKSSLTSYSIDGKRAFDLSNPKARQKLDTLLQLKQHPADTFSFYESQSSMESRLKNTRIITDDNMGTEWR